MISKIWIDCCCVLGWKVWQLSNKGILRYSGVLGLIIETLAVRDHHHQRPPVLKDHVSSRTYIFSIIEPGCDGRMVSASDPQPLDRGFESRQKPVGSSKPSRVGCGWRQWCLGSLSHKWVPGYRQRWQLYLDYPKRVSGCILLGELSMWWIEQVCQG